MDNKDAFLNELETLYHKYGLIITSYDGEFIQEADDKEIIDSISYLRTT